MRTRLLRFGLLGEAGRYGAGLLALAALSLLVQPVAVRAFSTHAAHWFGALHPELWLQTLSPMVARVHVLVMVPALAGWAAFATPAQPAQIAPWRTGLRVGLIGALVSWLGGLIAWVWWMRIGLIDLSALKFLVISLLFFVLTGLGAGAAGPRWGGGAALLSGAGGLLLLRWGWSLFELSA